MGTQQDTQSDDERDRDAIRSLLLAAFAALPPETRERVLIGGDDDDAELDAA